MSRNRRHPLRGLRPPGAPAELRRRALEAARLAPVDSIGTTGRPDRSLTDRLWESRALRLAWALLVVVLLGVNVLMDSEASVPEAERATGPGLGGEHGEPRTLFESRDPVLRALLGDSPAAGESHRPSENPRRKS